MLRRKLDIPVLWLLLIGMLVASTPRQARAYDQNTHQLIVDYSLGMYNQVNPGREPFDYWTSIRVGAWHEDEIDHVFGHGGLNVWSTHFWDADNGLYDPVTLAGLTGTFENTYQKVTGDGTSVPFGALWHQAVGYYVLGDKPMAYERLGHICHLIADMSVPAHVHEDAHAADHFEDTMEDDSWWVLQQLDRAELDKGLIDIPAPWSDTWQGVMWYLLYTTNQRADYFASAPPGEPWAGYWGDAVDVWGLVDYGQYAPQMAYYMDPDHVDTHIWYCPACGSLGNIGGNTHPCNVCGNWTQMADPAWIIAERYTTVYAVRATATLLDYWDRTIVPEPTTLALLAAGAFALRRRQQ